MLIYGNLCAVDEAEQEAEKKDEEETPSQEDGAGGDQAAPKKAGMKLSYEDYRTMANLLVCHMRRVEEEAAEKGREKGGKRER